MKTIDLPAPVTGQYEWIEPVECKRYSINSNMNFERRMAGLSQCDKAIHADVLRGVADAGHCDIREGPVMAADAVRARAGSNGGASTSS
ncbi:hypothetical protein LZC95_51350 [Pendulispora brunnea]|uniref:Uncharacterized protein n=1 Tax=Pendulispora brunnea TaxID=2905690 RepID=A0ABZ2KBP1_9BACT